MPLDTRTGRPVPPLAEPNALAVAVRAILYWLDCAIIAGGLLSLAGVGPGWLVAILAVVAGAVVGTGLLLVGE